MKKLIPFSLVMMAIGLFAATPARANGPYGANEIQAWSGPATGQVTVQWKQTSDQTNAFNLVYGTSAGNYQYGATNIPTAGMGNFTTYTVGYLNPGQTYYFTVSPVRSNVGQAYTNEVWATAMGGAAMMPNPSPGTGMTTTQPTTMIPAAAPSYSSAGPVGSNMLKAVTGPMSGQVTLWWMQVNGDTTGYNVMYGPSSGNYLYGVLNLGAPGSGSWTSYTVGSLNPGGWYCFAVSGIRANMGQATTGEVCQRAG